MMYFNKEQLDTLSAKFRQVDYGMLTTSDPAGLLSTRPLTQQQFAADCHLWFFTSDMSPFAHHLAAQPQANVSFCNPKENWSLSVVGRAELVTDKKKSVALWNPRFKSWLPGGIDDPQLVLIKMSVVSAEYRDAAAGSITQLVAASTFPGERRKSRGEERRKSPDEANKTEP